MPNFNRPPKQTDKRESLVQEEELFARTSEEFFRKRVQDLTHSLEEDAREAKQGGRQEDFVGAEYLDRWSNASREIFQFNHRQDVRAAAIKDPWQINNVLIGLVDEMSGGIAYFDNDRKNFPSDLIPETDKHFTDARQIFTDLGKRVFKDVPANASTDSLLRDARARGRIIGHPVLTAWHDYLYQNFKVTETIALRDADPETLLQKIENMIHSAGIDIETARLGASSEDEKAAIVETTKAVYALELLRNDLEKRITERKNTSATQDKEAASKAKSAPLEESLKRVATATSPEDVRRVVTPEIVQEMRARALKDIDSAIEQAERIIKNPEIDGILDKKTVVTVMGTGIQGSMGTLYQKIGFAKFGKVLSLDEITTMPIVEFMKKFFDYDVASDKARAEKLRRLTNAFD